MAVRIRMKKMGRAHRHFFRICAMDKRSPRDGRVLEELGTYDPNLTDVDARAVLKADRVDHWLSVGAQPSEKVAILIKKYGTDGTHVEAQKQALERLAMPYEIPDLGEAPKPAAPAEETPAEAPAEEAAAEGGGEEAAAEAPAEEPAAEEAPAEEEKSE